ncbi:MAG: CDP-alcohol phosphatidyltransferase family protein [Clostridiales bacterium]|nr:CDP-alcohol phosphatidyltransferase family protein [Clostridiales bacterium]
MKHIPNFLSALRLLMVGVFVYFYLNDRYFAALGVYSLAVLTDLLDGYLARRNNWITDIGKVLDPLADKLMLIAALVCFYTQGWIPLWLLVIVAGKEIIMIIGGALLLKHEVVVHADWFGKFASGLFNAGVIATLLKRFSPFIGRLNLVLLGIAAILAIIALVHYAKKNVLPQFKKDSVEEPLGKISPEGGEDEAQSGEAQDEAQSLRLTRERNKCKSKKSQDQKEK